MKRVLILVLVNSLLFCAFSQESSLLKKYEEFKNKANRQYEDFKKASNDNYAEFLREAWEWYEAKAPLPLPEERTPVPPIEYDEKEEVQPPVVIVPDVVPVIKIEEQPKPVMPIEETPVIAKNSTKVKFYELECEVRIPKNFETGLKGVAEEAVASAWGSLANNRGINNLIIDCLNIRDDYNLCDWAYTEFIDNVAHTVSRNNNEATLLMAYILGNSGYQMRLGEDDGILYMLFGSKHKIYGIPYYTLNDSQFYPYKKKIATLRICDVPLEGEKPLSLIISSPQILGHTMSSKKNIKSRRYNSMNLEVEVPTALIDFYNGYPRSEYGGDFMTTWAIYANTPLNSKVKSMLYPQIETQMVQGQELDNVSKILNWIQTGIVYEYDDVVWGDDRPFFSEETLYYPYADCEDRAILFSRLVRDILGLDAALIYYPGHLAAAVAFKEEIPGDAVNINGKKFTICDPTYIGAPCGRQMPGLEYDKIEAIVLN